MLAITSFASLVAGNLAASVAERAARASTERLLAQFATQVAHELAASLASRLSVLEATAGQIAASRDRGGDALRVHLRAMHARFPEFAWLGVADGRGRLVAEIGGPSRGESVEREPWFPTALTGPWVGEVARAAPPPKGAGTAVSAGAAADPFIEAAAPIVLAEGGVAGVVAGAIEWAWLERLQDELLRSLDTRRTVELVLADRRGTVLLGPSTWVGRSLADGDLSDGGAYLVARYTPRDPADAPLHWTVAVRESLDQAMEPARNVHRAVLATVLAAGALASLVGFWATRRLTRRLADLAAGAEAVQTGRRAGLVVPAGADEVSRIGATIAALVAHLQQEKAALAALNAELEARVAERTARVQRLADEARHAAVTRERLRLARDLHDTLAHSLMGLLAQLRLLRKMKATLSVSEFDAEIARAEAAAASGLAEARAAITQMRHGTVREIGLTAALRDLLARFGERTGVATTLAVRGAGADLADERAETLYRIVEEALRNVERHAQARSVAVAVAEDPAAADDGSTARVVVSVRDDGVGFDAAAARPGHYGLVGMREQAALIGAELEVRSAPGQGTEIRLALWA